MKRLIQTDFIYDADRSDIRGSYLGRKPASMATIRAFMRRNERIVWGGVDPTIRRSRYSNVRITGSHESVWVEK